MISSRYQILQIFVLMGLSFLLLVCSNPSKPDNNIPPVEEINFMDGWPSWSPDGRYIAYMHVALDWDELQRFGSRSIWVYDRQLRRYGFLVGPGMFPRWNPDGTILAFNGGGEIFFYYMESGTVRQVTRLGREIFTFHWSGNGNYVCADAGHFWLIDSTGRIARTIRPSNGVDTGWAAGSEANWTPSCDSILTLGGFYENYWSIFIIDSIGNLINTVLTRELYSEAISDLAWSPRRNRFAANYQVEINARIYNDLRLYRMDGSLERIISEQAGMADWSPDGRRIVYQKYTWMGDNPDPNSIDYSRVTIWESDPHGWTKHELMGWPQQGYDSTMFGGGYNWVTDTHGP
jgi:Tol biopolymer transport system component